ncbi:MAG: DUF763 domain-containing protein [Thaumarchaeota archaeon]|nr:DUF763 domain-containing protein [Nitrososphaerota archaeon]
MGKTGFMELPLHRGRAPRWLFERMKKLSKGILEAIYLNYGRAEILRRLSDPLWFQALGCVLGYDWHSSGLTTVVTGALREALAESDVGILVAGGKGGKAMKTQSELEEIGSTLGLSTWRIEELKRTSRLVAKVDSTAIQSGHRLYHHAVFVGEDGGWCVVQQGMNPADRTARRYHWLSEGLSSFVEEPHKGIIGDSVRPRVLNTVARESREARALMVDLVRDEPGKLISSVQALGGQGTLDGVHAKAVGFKMPSRLNWETFRRLYDFQPKGYEELLLFRGVGPATIRALALVAQLIYGTPVSWRDPVKFTFAHGGKDGVPFPVRRRLMERSISFLREAIESSELERREKLDALRRLSRLIP